MVRKWNRGAFTLVELLVVIGIIGVLIGILLPVLGRARRSAQDVICQSNLRQLGMGVQSYANQNNGALPQKGPDGSDQGANFFGNYPKTGVYGYDDPSIWFNAIPPMVSSKSYYDMLVDDYHGIPAPHAGGEASIFLCPLALPSASLANDLVLNDYFLLYGSDSSGLIKSQSGLQGNKQFKFALSYVWNSKLTSTINGPDVNHVKITDLEPSSEVAVIIEKISNPGEYKDDTVQRWDAANQGVYNGKITINGYNNKLGQSKACWNRFTTRHRSGGHILFADTHVAWFAWTDVQLPPSQLPFNPFKSDANQPGKIIWSVLGAVN